MIEALSFASAHLKVVTTCGDVNLHVQSSEKPGVLVDGKGRFFRAKTSPVKECAQMSLFDFVCEGFYAKGVREEE